MYCEKQSQFSSAEFDYPYLEISSILGTDMKMRQLPTFFYFTTIPSIYLSSTVKSRSNPFLEPTSTKQYVYSFLPKETTDKVLTNDCLITMQTRYQQVVIFVCCETHMYSTSQVVSRVVNIHVYT